MDFYRRYKKHLSSAKHVIVKNNQVYKLVIQIVQGNKIYKYKRV